MPDLTQFEYFRTVANLQHMTRAAEELHTSQSNLSNVIKRLEESLGVKLFDRKNGRIYLNEFGKIYLSAVNEAFDILTSAEKRIAELSARMEVSPLLIASNMQLYMENMLDAYYDTHKGSELPIIQGIASAEDIVRGLWNGDLDLALIPSSVDIPNVSEWTPVLTNRIGILAGAGHPLARQDTAALEELRNYPFICNNLGVGHDLIISLCQIGGFTPNIIYESNNSTSCGQWVEKGRGISFITAFDLMTLYSEGPAPQNVKVLPILQPELTVEMGLATVKEREYSEEKQQLIRFAKDYFQSLDRQIDQYWKTRFSIR